MRPAPTVGSPTQTEVQPATVISPVISRPPQPQKASGHRPGTASGVPEVLLPTFGIAGGMTGGKASHTKARVSTNQSRKAGGALAVPNQVPIHHPPPSGPARVSLAQIGQLPVDETKSAAHHSVSDACRTRIYADERGYDADVRAKRELAFCVETG
jgi:hypothetical protein